MHSVLVANRGEIARRIFRSCRALGLETVAVYSDPDADSPHVHEADAAVRLPGSAAADTYLRADLLISAAERSGADTVHPGYGFLAENADFAAAVQAAGLTWIGPAPRAIAVMSSKTQSKELMAAAGVPILTGLDPDAITEQDLPILVKASAGGGGRGMRIVRTLADLPAALTSAAAEARAAFGDGTVFCEPYLERGHHVEVQILADEAGTIWTLGERECSIQRRHQKIIEEAPSPLADRIPGMREHLFEAATSAARTIGYTNAGTVEFLADDSADNSVDNSADSWGGRFWFLEMNTRLQVEHTVTEAVTGLDLVAWQLKIAAGHRLTPAQPPPVTGHAIQARLYAEDPAVGWRPQAGTLHAFALPAPTLPAPTTSLSHPRGPGDMDVTATWLAGGQVRVDSGVASAGTRVSTHYDPMLAKIIAWAPDRDQAAAVLARTLATARVHGLTTNRDWLVRALRHPAFRQGDTDTAFAADHASDLAEPLAGREAHRLSALAAALAGAASQQQHTGVPVGWRNVPSQPQVVRYHGFDVRYRLERGRLVEYERDDVRLVSMRPGRVELEVAGVRRAFDVAEYDDVVCVDSSLGPVTLRPVPRFAGPASTAAPGSLRAPMPGTVARVAVTTGETVQAGQPLLWLEAMKMEHVIAAPAAGVVAELSAKPGQQVEPGAVLAVIKEAPGELHRDR